MDIDLDSKKFRPAHPDLGPPLLPMKTNMNLGPPKLNSNPTR